jgi:transposase-like protein/IS1 family transposase
MKAMAKTKVTMNCQDCEIRCASFGTHRNGLRRFRCGKCGKTYTEPHEKPLGEMTVPMEKAILALRMLLEGSSVRSVERVTELHRDTILKLLVVAGEKCANIMGRYVRNVPVQDVEVDELWSFIGKKEKRVRIDEDQNLGIDEDQNLGDCYTFVAIERNTKLVLNIAMGKRDQLTTNAFIEGLRDAIAPGRFQITSDGFAPYKTSIPDTFGNVDYAMLIKVYRATPEGERKYSPAEVSSVEVVPVYGNPDPDRICTSIVERSNLSVRMGCRRFTRLTNAFSKKWENHWAAVTLWYTYYNFCRIHQTLRVTPAMEAGIADHQWRIEELLA